MKLNALFLLSSVALGTAVPTENVALAADAAAGLEKRDVTCPIKGNGVKCHASPRLNAPVEVTFDGRRVIFRCDRKVPGQCSGGNCYWDYNPTYNCWVNARYTGGANCNPKNLPKC